MASTRERWPGPFHRLVVLGDSIAHGMCASRPERAWVPVTANLLREFQDADLTLLNNSIPANVISPRCPGYEASAKPSLLERYKDDCLGLDPDLVVIAEGTNDLRSGMPVQDYLSDLDELVRNIRRECHTKLVLVGIYYQVYGHGANDPRHFPTWSRWTPDTAKLFNLSIRLVAERYGALFVDALSVLGWNDWVLDADCCHLNDLGHTLIGNAVFHKIVTHRSGPQRADPRTT